MLFEELKELEKKLLKENADSDEVQRFYEVCEAYFVAKFIDGVCFSDKGTIKKMLSNLNVAQYTHSDGVLLDDLKLELGIDIE